MGKRGSLIGIFLVAAGFFLAFNGSLAITDPVESNYALTAREMVESGDWLSPRIYGQFWYDKPIMIYWLIALSFKWFGFTDFAARIPSALFGASAVAFLYWFAVRLYRSRNIGLWSAAVLATSLEYWVLSHMIITDAVLFFFTAVSLSLYYLAWLERRSWYALLAYAAAGLAVLTKGPVGLVLPGMIIFSFILVTRRWELLRRLHLVAGLAVFAIVAVPWYWLMYLEHGQAFVDTFLGLHNYLRATVSEHPKDNVFYYYLVLFPASLLPWTGVFLRGLFVRRIFRPEHYEYLVNWLGVTLVFYTLMATKYPTYVFPAMFPAALLTGYQLEHMRQSRAGRTSWFWLTVPAVLLLAVYGVAVNVLTGAKAAPILPVSAGLAILLIGWLQMRKKYRVMPQAVTVSTIVLSVVLLGNALVPLTAERSAKAAVAHFPAGSGVEAAAYGEYATSAVYYSGHRIPWLVSEKELSKDAGVWSSKYTMPLEDGSQFAARTVQNPSTYILVSKDALPAFEREPFALQFQQIAKDKWHVLFRRSIKAL